MLKFGRYELLERISLGGMAEVYKARVGGAAGFQKILALKRILPQLSEDFELEQMFINEAKLSANLNHSCIGQIYDFGEIAGQYYIAMEYIHGRDLRAIQQYFRDRAQAMPLAMSLRIALDVCSALDYAHNQADASGHLQRIVHRDVSPPNILVSFDGAVKLIDFGIAKALNHTKQTATGFLKGKLGYLSPEQAEGREIDYRSDIFSLGTVLFESVTGIRLFDENTDMATLTKVRRAEVPAPSMVNAAVPRSLDPIVLRALERRPEDRYQRADQFYEALETYAQREHLTLGDIQLARWMARAFEPAERGTEVSPAKPSPPRSVISPPSGAMRLEPEPAFSSYDEEASSLPTFPHSEQATHLENDPQTQRQVDPPTELQLRPPMDMLLPAAPAEVDPEAAASSTRISLQSARLAAQLAGPKPAAPAAPAPSPEEVLIEAEPAYETEPTMASMARSAALPVASIEPPKPLFKSDPVPDDGWENLKTTPHLGARLEPAAPPSPAEVVVPWTSASPPDQTDQDETLSGPPRRQAGWPDQSDPLQRALDALSSDPGLLEITNPLGRAAAPPLEALRPEPQVAPPRVFPEGRPRTDPTRPEPVVEASRASAARAPAAVRPTRTPSPKPDLLVPAPEPALPSAPARPADDDRLAEPLGGRPAAAVAPPASVLRSDTGAWATEPTLTGEEEVAPSSPAPPTWAQQPALAITAPAPASAPPAPEPPPGRPAQPVGLGLIGEMMDLEEGAASSEAEAAAMDASNLPSPSPRARPSRPFWLLWLALAMFALGMVGTLIAILLRH